MIPEPLISVLMPVYNGEKFVAEAIESILNQSYTNFEFIIINDGSEDLTENIILSYKDNRILYVKNEINIKLIKTLNKGIDLAKGEYIARMDADDISLPYRLKVQMDQINEHKCNIVSSSYISINEYSNKTGYHLGINADQNDLKFISMFFCPISHPTVLIEKNTLKKYYYKDDGNFTHMEDYELWSRILKDNIKIKVTNKPLLFYRRSESNITELHKGESLLKHIKLAKQNQIEFLNEFLSDNVIFYFISPNSINSSIVLKSVYKEIICAKNKFIKNQFKLKYATLTWLDYRILTSIVKCKISIKQKIFFLILKPNIFLNACVYVLMNSFRKQL
jgi:glycosyltransferase involved in cell wall biosynthesis